MGLERSIHESLRDYELFFSFWWIKCNYQMDFLIWSWFWCLMSWILQKPKNYRLACQTMVGKPDSRGLVNMSLLTFSTYGATTFESSSVLLTTLFSDLHMNKIGPLSISCRLSYNNCPSGRLMNGSMRKCRLQSLHDTHFVCTALWMDKLDSFFYFYFFTTLSDSSSQSIELKWISCCSLYNLGS